MRQGIFILLLSAAVGAAAWGATPSETGEQLAKEGRSLFLACEFKQAARAFEKAVAAQPDHAAHYYWLGKSYSRLADVSGPLSAPKYARRAGGRLEQAVRMDPHNEEYARELFEFYVDSPEWFGGGLARARMLLGESSLPPSMMEAALRQIAASRDEHSGAPWRMREAILRTSGMVGSFVPGR